MSVPPLAIKGRHLPRASSAQGMIYFEDIHLSVDEEGDVNIDEAGLDEPLFIAREDIQRAAEWFAALAKATGKAR